MIRRVLGGPYFVRVSNRVNTVDSPVVEPPSGELRELTLGGAVLAPELSPSSAEYSFSASGNRITVTAGTAVGDSIAVKLTDSHDEVPPEAIWCGIQKTYWDVASYAD